MFRQCKSALARRPRSLAIGGVEQARYRTEIGLRLQQRSPAHISEKDFQAAVILYRTSISFVSSLIDGARRFAAISRSNSIDEGPNRTNRLLAVSAVSPYFF